MVGDKDDRGGCRVKWLYEVVYASLLGLAHLAAPLSKKVRLGIDGRMGLLQRLKPHVHLFDSKPIWFHVASSGEFEQLLPILDAVRAKDPGIPNVVTYFSPTAKRAVELEKTRREAARIPIPWDVSDFSPYDLKTGVKPFLDLVRPRAFVAIHRELWPGVLWECRRRNIPSFLFAAFFPKVPKPWWLFRDALEGFSRIGTTSQKSASLLSGKLPASRIEHLGDPRIDRVLSRKKNSNGSAFCSEGKTAVFASLWPEELETLQGRIAALLKEFGDWRFIFVPHEPSEKFTQILQRIFSKAGKSFVQLSDWNEKTDPASSILVDQVGFLAELYGCADWVFVGGSFRRRVHNVLEPAAYGKPVLTGPHIWNSGEALEMESENAGLFRSNSPEEFEAIAKRLMTDESLRHRSSTAITSYLEARKGAAVRYADLLSTLESP